MSRGDLVVVIACAVVGYWLVKVWMGLREPRNEPSSASRRETTHDDETPASASNWHQILAVSPDAHRDEIVAAWRRRVSEYHPDKVAGMAPEIRELAHRRTQRVNAAYEIGMRYARP